MKKASLIIFFTTLLSFFSGAQDILETDKLGEKAVLVIPSASIEQLNGLQSAFEGIPKIASAVFVFQGHNCLLITFTSASDISLETYSDILKRVASSIPPDMVFIKHPKAFDEITEQGIDATSIIIK